MQNKYNSYNDDKKSCGDGREDYTKKIGTCKKCIISSICLSIITWFVYLFILNQSTSNWLKYIILFFACVFTGLMLTHFLTAFIKKLNYSKETNSE